MPLPTPNEGESQDEFISRCMGNETAMKDFPDQEQRSAVCFRQWRERNNAARMNEVDTVPTDEMARVAKRALEWREEFDRGGTDIGVERANQIVNKENLSEDTINRMVSYFARHEVDKEAEGFTEGEEGFPSAGRIAWDLWGGDPGKAWSERKQKEFEKESRSNSTPVDSDATDDEDDNHGGQKMSRQYEIRAEAGKPQQREFLGQPHTVIPLVALVEGVLQGVNAPAPEYVSAEAMARSVMSWNGRPVVIDHPRVNGQLVSANLPEVLETELVGQVFNARVEEGKLKMEAWVNNKDYGAERINNTLSRVLEGEVVELSTGFFADVQNMSGRFQDEPFDAVLTNIQPDHLAILSEGKGACSVEDGCGANRVNAVHEGTQPKLEPRAAADCSCKEERSFLDVFKEAFGIKTNRTHDDEYAALDMKLAQVITDEFFMVYAVQDGRVTYFTPSGLFQRPFEFAEDGSVKLGEEAIQVRPETDFVPLKAHEEKNMPDTETKSKVNALIANEATQFTEDDRPWLEGLEEAQLAKLEPVANEKHGKKMEDDEEDEDKDKMRDNASPEPRSFEDVLASAPAEVRESINYGQRLYAEYRGDLVKTIKANEKNDFSDDELDGMDMKMLERLAKMSATTDFSGRGFASKGTPRKEDDAVPAPPLVFEAPQKQAS